MIELLVPHSLHHFSNSPLARFRFPGRFQTEKDGVTVAAVRPIAH